MVRITRQSASTLSVNGGKREKGESYAEVGRGVVDRHAPAYLYARVFSSLDFVVYARNLLCLKYRQIGQHDLLLSEFFVVQN